MLTLAVAVAAIIKHNVTPLCVEDAIDHAMNH